MCTPNMLVQQSTLLFSLAGQSPLPEINFFWITLLPDQVYMFSSDRKAEKQILAMFSLEN